MSEELKYLWVATYKDESEFPQFNTDGSENLFGDIEQDRLDSFCFISTTGHKIRLDVKDDMRLICFRRHKINFIGKGEQIEYVLGYQKTLDGRNIKAMMIVDELGNVTLVDGDVNENKQ